jgi:hypothetical protein
VTFELEFLSEEALTGETINEVVLAMTTAVRMRLDSVQQRT